MKIQIKRLTPTSTIPQYKTEGAAAFDLYADLLSNGDDACEMEPGFGGAWLVPTGIAMSIPKGYVGIIVIRSGLAHKKGFMLSNGSGIIDSDYRGEIFINLVNNSNEDQEILHGDRIAQMLIMPVVQVGFELVDKLDDTKRGSGGFGSTDSPV